MRAGGILRGSLVIILTLGAASSWGASYGGGTGEPNDPYLIYTAEQMNTIGTEPNDWGKHFKLMADIDLAAYTGTQFHVIGRTWDEGKGGFEGVFDGNGHAISNFTRHPTDGSSASLFGVLVGFDAEIRNLRLISPVVVAEEEAIACTLVNYVSNGTVTNCHVRGGSVTGGLGVGGLVGELGGVIDQCSVEDCTIDGVKYVGGLVGLNRGLVANCYITGTVTADTRAGGLAGETMLATIVNCYTSVAVSGDTRVGGLVGYNRHTDIKDCYSVGPVTGSNLVGGLVGEDTTPDSVTGSFWNTQTSGQATSGSGTGKTTAELQDPATFVAAGWAVQGFSTDPSNIWRMNPDSHYPMLWWQVDESQWPPLPAFAGGTGTPQDPYLVATAQQLNYIGHNPALMPAHFRLAGDIDLQGIDFFSIGTEASPYRGVFDGAGKVIANFTQTDPNGAHVGLFGYVRGKEAHVLNLDLLSPEVNAQKESSVGALVGYLNGGAVTNCHVEGGTISGLVGVGGLVGASFFGAITDCSAAARVAGASYVGGLVGNDAWGSITHCCATGPVAGGEQVGGLAGLVGGTATECYATGPVTGENKTGGLAGINVAQLMDCHAEGDVNGVSNTGGLVGENTYPITRCYATGRVSGQDTTGGLVGYSHDDINDCHATGAVTGFSDIGGLVGRQEFGTVADSYATGTVSGSVSIGGLAGSNKNEWGYIVSCLATGAVTGSSQTGGLVGMNSGTIANSYASGSVSGWRGVGGLVGRNGERIEISGRPTTESPGIITNCYSTGHVSAVMLAGGLVGLQECGSATASFWDKETSGQTASAVGTGKSTAGLWTAATFLDVGWDFVDEVQNGTADIWWMREGLDYPHLSWEPRPEQP